MLRVVTDPLVVSQFVAGDEDAVRMVYRAYGRLVFAVAYKVLGDRGLAEEATQQTFLQAWRASASFQPSKEFGPWIATIARRAHTTYETFADGDLEGMLRDNLTAERIVITTYQEIIRWIGDGDPTTRRLLEDILADEEEHADDLVDLLGA